MKQRLACAALLLALSACAGQPGAPEPSGPYRPLNPGRWTPNAGDLRPALPGEAAR